MHRPRPRGSLYYVLNRALLTLDDAPRLQYYALSPDLIGAQNPDLNLKVKNRYSA